MLILLGIDSQFATVEVIITTLKDGFSDWIDRYIKYHEVLVLLVCILGFLFGIPHVFNVSFQKKKMYLLNNVKSVQYKSKQKVPQF